MRQALIPNSKATRIIRQTKVICFFRNVFFLTTCISAGSLVYVHTKPQKHELHRLQAKLAEVKKAEQRILSEQEHRQIELQALRQDPTFLDLHARDRLDVCNDGERILKFRRDR